VETLVALGTLALAVVTAYLAWKTRSLAIAATEDQRSRWRPILIAADQVVDEDVEGELRIRVRNVGQGPALGVGGQLRIKGPTGAVIPGSPSTALVDDVLELRFSLKEKDFWRGYVVRFEVTYFDIKEWWHVTDITATIREQPDGSKPLRIAGTFVSETGRRLGPVYGSRRAKADAERHGKRPWNRVRNFFEEKVSSVRKRLRGDRPDSGEK
jgi:hypothetical protein